MTTNDCHQCQLKFLVDKYLSSRFKVKQAFDYTLISNWIDLAKLEVENKVEMIQA